MYKRILISDIDNILFLWFLCILSEFRKLHGFLELLNYFIRGHMVVICILTNILSAGPFRNIKLTKPCALTKGVEKMPYLMSGNLYWFSIVFCEAKTIKHRGCIMPQLCT